jgi:hypothetical protein
MRVPAILPHYDPGFKPVAALTQPLQTPEVCILSQDAKQLPVSGHLEAPTAAGSWYLFPIVMKFAGLIY